MPLVNFRKIFWLFSFYFCQNFDVRTFSWWLGIRGTKFFGELSEDFFFSKFSLWSYKMGSWPIFQNFDYFWWKFAFYLWFFLVIFENYSTRTLSMRGNDFIAHWAYAERIFAYAQRVEKCFYMYIYAKNTGKWFYRTLSIRGNDLNAGWAYAEMISSLTEHMLKCLKVQYLGWIEYDFQKKSCYGYYKDLFLLKK